MPSGTGENHQLNGRVALVTGASRGIGAALATALALQGAQVIALARTQGALEALDDQIQAAGGPQITLMPMDLRRGEEIDKLGPSILERFGHLDILVCNAGMLGPLTPAHQVSAKDWDRVMDVNFTANVRLVRALDPLLRVSDAGRVLLVSSVLAANPMAYWGPYIASKMALEGFGLCYALENKASALRVNILRPSATDTSLLREAFPGGFSGSMHTPHEVAQAALPLLLPGCKSQGSILSLD